MTQNSSAGDASAFKAANKQPTMMAAMHHVMMYYCDKLNLHATNINI
jgi:hypothetical protein